MFNSSVRLGRRGRDGIKQVKFTKPVKGISVSGTQHPGFPVTKCLKKKKKTSKGFNEVSFLEQTPEQMTGVARK